MICTTENIELVCDLMTDFGVEVTEMQAETMLRHLDLVEEKNQVMNLTRIVEPLDAIVRHVIDSLLLVPSIDSVNRRDTTRFVDVGTGAGFPGIPIAVMTSSEGVLIDSVGKKIGAVNEFLHQLGLDDRVHAVTVRAEDFARTNRSCFDYVIARAVADLGVLVEYASPLLRHEGSLVVSKARIADEEIMRGDKTAELAGMQRVSRETYELPYDQGHREVFIYQKTARAKVRLPRATGMAKNRPLV